MSGHLATNKMYESVTLGEWVEQKRRKRKLEYCIDKVLPWEAVSEEERISKGLFILKASFWITVYWQRFYCLHQSYRTLLILLDTKWIKFFPITWTYSWTGVAKTKRRYRKLLLVSSAFYWLCKKTNMPDVWNYLEVSDVTSNPVYWKKHQSYAVQNKKRPRKFGKSQRDIGT